MALMVGDRAASKPELAQRPPPHCRALTPVSQVLVPPSLLPGQPGPSLTAAFPPPKPAPVHRAAQVSFKNSIGTRTPSTYTMLCHLHLRQTQTQSVHPSLKPSRGSHLYTNPDFCDLYGLSLDPRLPQPWPPCFPWDPCTSRSACTDGGPPRVSAPMRRPVLTGPALTTLTRARLSHRPQPGGHLSPPLSPGPAVMTAAPCDTPWIAVPLRSPFRALPDSVAALGASVPSLVW